MIDLLSKSTVAPGAATRATEQLYGDFRREVVVAAQGMGSIVAEGACSMRSISSNNETVPVVKQVDFKAAPFGYRDTPLDNLDTERRTVYTTLFERNDAIDKADQSEIVLDILDVARMQLAKSYKRVLDQVVLNEIIGPAHVEDKDDTHSIIANSAGAAGSDELEAASYISNYGRVARAYPTKYNRRNLYGMITQTVGQDVDAFSSAQLENITNVLRLRDSVDEQMYYITYTPRLRMLLRNDTAFVNRENLFTSGALANGLVRTFSYRDFMFITVSNVVLPKISSDNLLVSVGATSTDRRIVVRDAKDSDDILTKNTLTSTDYSTTELGAASIRDGAHSYDIAATGLDKLSRHIVHVWHPSHLCLYEATGDTIMRLEDERKDKRYAKQSFMRIRIGALLDQEDFALSFLLPGSGAKYVAAGTGSKTSKTIVG